eukprot:1155575-Pelagomonas_calceolata.AAC.4
MQCGKVGKDAYMYALHLNSGTSTGAMPPAFWQPMFSLCVVKYGASHVLIQHADWQPKVGMQAPAAPSPVLLNFKAYITSEWPRACYMTRLSHQGM